MAKDKSEADMAAKKEKKEKKRKHDEVEVDEAAPKKSKKEKKEKRKSEGAAIGDDSVMDIDGHEPVKAEVEAKDSSAAKITLAIPLSALVPFANPLAAEKDQKKVLKSVKKGKL